MGQPRSKDHGAIDTGIEAVGTALRERREELALSRSDLAQRLHMGEEQLQALEEGELTRLNEPVFIKAMVRRVASHLELDADHLVGQLSLLSNPSRKLQHQKPADGQPGDAAGQSLIKPLLAVLALLAGGTAWFLLKPAPREIPSTAEVFASPPQARVPDEARTSTTTRTRLTLDSIEPSWIALRRNGTVFFEGKLSAPMDVQDPSGVEVYAGRPDQVTVTSDNKPPESLGGISDVRWYSLSPER